MWRIPIPFLVESGAACIGTPDDAIAYIENLVKGSGGFGAIMELAHNWADWEQTKRHYELTLSLPQAHVGSRRRMAVLDVLKEYRRRGVAELLILTTLDYGKMSSAAPCRAELDAGRQRRRPQSHHRVRRRPVVQDHRIYEKKIE